MLGNFLTASIGGGARGDKATTSARFNQLPLIPSNQGPMSWPNYQKMPPA